jgi:hypothetical protein
VEGEVDWALLNTYLDRALTGICMYLYVCVHVCIYIYVCMCVCVCVDRALMNVTTNFMCVCVYVLCMYAYVCVDRALIGVTTTSRPLQSTKQICV